MTRCGADEVAATRGRGSDPRGLLADTRSGQRTEVRRVPEGEDAAVGSNQPVTLTAAGDRHPDDRRVEPHVPRRTLEGGVAEREDAAVTRLQPIALARRR